MAGLGIPKLYVKFWWPLFLVLKTRLFWPKVTRKVLKASIYSILKVRNKESSRSFEFDEGEGKLNRGPVQLKLHAIAV